jgi:hypothetical protein
VASFSTRTQKWKGTQQTGCKDSNQLHALCCRSGGRSAFGEHWNFCAGKDWRW